jgi:hypothetical protein
LIIPCEITVKSVIPAIKALLAKELVEAHNLKQSQAAEILGISQSAVSKYSTKTRGHVIKIEDIEEIQAPINEMITLLISGTDQRTEFLKFFCQTCTIIRKRGLMCQFCRKTEPTLRMEECNFCRIRLNSRSK